MGEMLGVSGREGEVEREGGEEGEGGRSVRMGLGTGSQENILVGKVRVEGARRVWGTMKVTSSSGPSRYNISLGYIIITSYFKNKLICR